MTQDHRCFVIAEAGVNHNGSLELALKLVEVAANAGADAVKFQTFDADRLACPGAGKAAYQQQHTGVGDQLEMLRQLELPRDWHAELRDHATGLGLQFMSTAFAADSVDFLVELGVERIKVPSGELNNLPLLEHISSKGRPVLLSTGMGTLDEVAAAVDVISLRQDDLTLLHCTSSYPASFDDVNLRAMVTLGRAFDLPFGYSDHTEGIVAAPIAVGLGAVVIEKHVTLDRSLPGPDHAASLEPGELGDMIANIRVAERLAGSPIKRPTVPELAVRDVVRRSVTVKRPLSRGHVVTADDVTLLRPGTGIAPVDLTAVVGCRLKTDTPQWHTLRWEDLEATRLGREKN